MHPTRCALALAALAVLPGVMDARQHPGAPRAAAPAAATPPPEAAQFDFLLGDWTLAVRVPARGLAQRIHGVPRLVGTWTATRALDGWGISDELRITDAAGNPISLTHSIRVYDAAARRWNVTAVDAYRARITTPGAEWQGREMVITGQGADAEGRAFLTRTRIYDITAGAFRLQQDRSFDAGRTWEEAQLRIDARRATGGAAR